MPETPSTSIIEIAPGVRVHESVLEFSFTTSSGPGGQNVNKRATRAELRVKLADLPVHPAARHRLADAAGWRVTPDGVLILDSGEHRSQLQNKGECLERLRELVTRAIVVPKVRKKTKPSRGSKERRLAGKKARSEIKGNRRSRPED
ncbi:MAG: aminoacyl-tRNA hydrolase [Phycisphaerales bacterium]|nr:aminoacyl-tRNA hydrolase [Phycisphaerales bacterium]